MLLKKYPASSIAAIAALLITPSVWAADTLTDALTGGKASANLQYRYEDVSNGAATKNTATAHTVCLRLGYETATFNGFGAMVEAESVKDLGNKKYDSKATGQTGVAAVNNYAVIADPEATEINQAYLSYSGIANTTVKFGRQRIILDNARFVGNVGWRQNEQTFDAVRGQAKIGPVKFDATYSISQRSDYGANPVTFDADYWNAQIGLGVAGFSLAAGYEELGSDGGAAAFQTPLATLHAFNGWADLFLATPANGLRDYYAGVGKTFAVPFLPCLKADVTYHEFDSDFGG